MELRWILILISLIILALIFIDGWRRIKRQQKQNRRIMVPGNEAFKRDTVLKNQNPSFENEDLSDAVDDGIVATRKTMHEPNKDSLLETNFADEATEQDKKDIPDTLFVINVMALPGNMFSGSQLLPSLLALGLRHGEMSIFHRHEQSSGVGSILFSLTSAIEPGVFNLTTMESQYFTGVTLFLRIPGPKNAANALNLMLQTAKRLAQMLEGELRDENHRLLTSSEIEQHYNGRLRQTLGQF